MIFVQKGQGVSNSVHRAGQRLAGSVAYMPGTDKRWATSGGDISAAHQFLNTFTVEMWLYPTELGATNRPLFRKLTTTSSQEAGYNFGISSTSGSAPSSQRLRAVFYLSSNSTTISSDTSINLVVNRWQHVAFVFGTNSIGFYVNGQFVNASRTAGNLYWASNPAERIGDTSNSYAGYITELRIWNEARTARQIRDNMYRRIPVGKIEPGLVTCVPLNTVYLGVNVPVPLTFGRSLLNFSSTADRPPGDATTWRILKEVPCGA